ncbi:hypothetical protein GCM10027440_41930 [Nocardiopsis coralliicola]
MQTATGAAKGRTARTVAAARCIRERGVAPAHRGRGGWSTALLLLALARLIPAFSASRQGKPALTPSSAVRRVHRRHRSRQTPSTRNALADSHRDPTEGESRAAPFGIAPAPRTAQKRRIPGNVAPRWEGSGER